ncbi:MAG: hypothetical protein H8E53_06650 [Planctomycetes bacterium]|nr:hypothetical protein [Planctomycetota bacterium]
MQMIAMLRIPVIALVLGSLAMSGTHAAEPEPIQISSANLKGGLVKKDIAQIQLHTKYWVAELAAAKTAGGVYRAREGILADYGKYATSLRYQVEFARSAAAVITRAMGKLTANDPLVPVKEINCAIVISKMPQLTAVTAIDAMVGSTNPGVRFLAWKGYEGIRKQVIRKGGKVSNTLFATLTKHAATEPSPLVATVIIDVLHIKKSDLTAKPFTKAFDRSFNTLVGMLKTCCDRLADGDAAWARPCIAAIPVLLDAAEFYKPDNKKSTLIIQQLVNIAQAAAKAFAATDGTGNGAFHCAPLLLKVEPAIGSLTKDSGREIRNPLLDRKMSPKEKSSAVRRGVLEWIARLDELGIKKPVFTPIKPPAPTTQPAAKTSV